MGNVSVTQAPADHATQDLGVGCIPDPVVALIQGQVVVLMQGRVVARTRALEEVNILALVGQDTLAQEVVHIPAREAARTLVQEVARTRALVGRAILGLTMAKLIDGIGHRPIANDGLLR